MEAKIVNLMHFIRLKNKERVVSQGIFSFINKGDLQLDCQKLSDIICDIEIDGKIYKNGSGKNASFFVNNYFSMEAVFPDKNWDLILDNTHSQSSVLFSPGKYMPTSDTSHNLETLMESIQQSKQSVM